MQAFSAQLEQVLIEADFKSPAPQTNGDNLFGFFQAPAPKKRRLNPAVPWSKYLADPNNSKCLSLLAAEFLKVCKSLDSVNEPLALLFQTYHNSLQSPARSAFLLALLYNIFLPNSTLPLYDRIKSPISLSRSFVQLTQYLDVSNQFQWIGTMSLLLRCLQQPDCETIPSETAVAIVTSLLKKINLLPLNCNQDQRECAIKGLEVIRVFLEIPSATKSSHVTYYDLLREIPQVFPPGVVVHWTLESFMNHLQRRRRDLASLIMPPDASWPLISQVSRQHEFTNLTQRPSHIMFAADYADGIRDGHMTTYVSLFGDLLYQRAPSDEIFFMIRQLPHSPAGISSLRESLVVKTRDVVRCIQRHSRFHESRQADLTLPVQPNPEMVIPDNIDFMELLVELSDQLYAFVGSELSQISNIYPTGYSVLYEDLIADYHALITGSDKAPPELEKDNTLIFLLLQLIHIEKVGGKDKLLTQDYAGDEQLFRLLIALYNEDQVNSKDGFYLRDLALQCAISHQQGHIRDRTMMKYRHPKLAVIWPYYSQVCYNIQSYFVSKYKNNVQDTTSLSNLSTQENVKIAMESQLRQHIVAGTLFIYLVPNYQGKEPELDASNMFLKGGAISYKLLDMLNIDTKHRLLGLIYKMMLDGEQGPRFHGDTPQVKFVSPYVIDVVYKLLSSTPCSVEPVMKVLFDKLRRYDRLPKTMPDVPAEVTRWQFTVLQLLNFRLIRPLKFTATCAHLLHYMKFALSMTKHRTMHNVVEACNHSALGIQTSHKFLRSLVDNKRERPFWFEESEALARRAVLTVARVIKLRGQGDAPLGIITEILQILHKHPIVWTEEVMAFFPEPVREFYKNQEQTTDVKSIPGAVTELEVTTLLEGTSVHNVLLVPKGTEPNTYLLSHYSDMANHPFFLCVFWEFIIIHQQITETMLEDVRAVMLQFPPSHMSTYTQQLIDYALWKLDPKNPNATGSVEFVVRIFEELVWKYQLLTIEHTLLALMTGHPSRSGDLGLKILIQMTVNSSELSNRISHWTSIGISPRPWEEDAYYEKVQQYLSRYPEYFGFEAHEVRTGANPIQPPLEMPLLTSYNNVLLRLLNIFDMIIGRFIEYQMTDTLVTFLDKFGCLYLYHSTPMGFVRDTLLYYYESPTVRDPRVMKALLKLMDFKQVEFSPVLTDYAQEMNSRSEDLFDETYLHDVCRKLAVSMDPKECGYKTDPSMPERHYREISNPATQGLYIAIIETLSAPISKEKIVTQILNLILGKRTVSKSSTSSSSGSASSSHGSNSCKVVPEAKVIHAAGLLLSALPKEFMDIFFMEVDAFTRTDETLLQASTISIKSTVEMRAAAAAAALGRRSNAANTVNKSTTGRTGAEIPATATARASNNISNSPSASSVPETYIPGSSSKRTTAQEMLLSTFFTCYSNNRNNYRSNMPNSFLTFFHAVAHYSSADMLLRLMQCLENWRRGTCLPPPQGSSLLNYNGQGSSSLIRINNQYDSLRDESIEDRHISPAMESDPNGMDGLVNDQNRTINGLESIEEEQENGYDTTAAHAEEGRESVKMKKNQSIRTDVQLLFICALIGPLVHRFEKLQIGGTTGYFLVVLVELFAMITDQLEVAATPGLCTFEQVIDFIHHVRAQIPKDPDTSARLALVLKGMRPWIQGRLGSIV
ncbi:Mediator of RNA polymerase II transcription subunit 23 [Gryganskiella cystojenkinii]|nr:Mediator of RNA polymerase II transcription subunit 23 [Gryganskiella cystojenkinii]